MKPLSLNKSRRESNYFSQATPEKKRPLNNSKRKRNWCKKSKKCVNNSSWIPTKKSLKNSNNWESSKEASNSSTPKPENPKTSEFNTHSVPCIFSKPFQNSSDTVTTTKLCKKTPTGSSLKSWSQSLKNSKKVKALFVLSNGSQPGLLTALTTLSSLTPPMK